MKSTLPLQQLQRHHSENRESFAFPATSNQGWHTTAAFVETDDVFKVSAWMS